MNPDRRIAQTEVRIREERPGDYQAVEAVHERAFGGSVEALLVRQLRKSSDSLISLVAVVDDLVIGHILFSPVRIIHGKEEWPALGLGPMAVVPEHQRKGIGAQLVGSGLALCRQSGSEIVVVLGHPGYYPRFGFVPGASKGIRYSEPVPEEVFMVLELKPGSLTGRQGIVKYHEAFGQS